MKEDVKDKWVAALRSGKYAQVQKTLRTDNGFCCLGVLCDVLGASWRKDTGLNVYVVGEVTGSLPHFIAESAGMKTSSGGYGMIDVHGNQQTLILDNDVRCKNFNEIADIVEEYWQEL